MSVPDELKAALLDTLGRQLTDFQNQINMLNNAIIDRQKAIDGIQNNLSEQRALLQKDKTSLNGLERRLRNTQNTIQKLNDGDIVIN